MAKKFFEVSCPECGCILKIWEDTEGKIKYKWISADSKSDDDDDDRKKDKSFFNDLKSIFQE